MTDTYNTILSIARNLFIQQGYTATSMRQVAEAVGIGKATIYHHFPDKRAILMTLVDGNIGKVYASLSAIQAEPDPQRRFQVAATESIRFLYESAELLQIARREVPGARQQMVAHFISFYQEYLKLLKEALVTGMEMKIFRAVDPEDAVQVFITMIQGNFAVVYLTGARAESAEKAAARVLDIFFNGINAPSPAAKEGR